MSLVVVKRPPLIKPGDPEFERWRQRHPPMSGAAGWSLGTAFQSATGSVVGTTGRSISMTGGVTAGQLVVACGVFTSAVAGLNFTVSDLASNVTAWNQNQVNDTTAVQYLEIAWGIATATAACTPKIVISSGVNTILELVTASFNVPVSSTIAQDGALAKGVLTSNTTHPVLPVANGTGSNDALFNIMGTGGSFTTYNAPWTTGANTGDGYGYILNTAGNIANDCTTTTGGYVSISVAISATPSTPPPTPQDAPIGMFDPALNATAWF